MLLSETTLIGFRNFKNAKINLVEKSLVIGPNDIGKTNLICALRILLDKTFSVSDIEPKDTDFYAHEETNEISITLKFTNITAECIWSFFGKFGAISEDGTLYLQYKAYREQSGRKDFKFFAGKDLNSLKDLEGRPYLKHLNLSYVNSNRDLNSYLKKEKIRILEDAKAKRTPEQIEDDNIKTKDVERQLETINLKVNELHYIKSSTDQFNTELKKLSAKNESGAIGFDSGAIDTEKYLQNLDLVSKVGDKKITSGGDGKNNQIFLAMWSSRIDPSNPAEVTIFCIEEPEAHLHPHQQRRLAEYLATKIHGQVIISTHSPQIACEFTPNSIVKLYAEGACTKAANDGCSKIIEESFINFGHRLNIIPAEAFFSNVVLLVEGVSEVIFYKALAAKLNGMNLDRLNISIVAVDGIGFETYIKIFYNLGIPVIVRTDNDYSKIPRIDKFSCVGIRRGIDIAKLLNKKSFQFTKKEELHNLTQDKISDLPQDKINLIRKIKIRLCKGLIFIAENDLEQDLINSEIKAQLVEHYGEGEEINDDKLYQKMTKKKGEHQFNFLQKYSDNLVQLKDSDLAKPLLACKKLIDSLNGTIQ